MVSLRGPTTDVAKIDEKDVYAVVDLSNAVVGESSTVLAEILIHDGPGTVGILGTYTVLVTVEEI